MGGAQVTRLSGTTLDNRSRPLLHFYLRDLTHKVLDAFSIGPVVATSGVCFYSLLDRVCPKSTTHPRSGYSSYV